MKGTVQYHSDIFILLDICVTKYIYLIIIGKFNYSIAVGYIWGYSGSIDIMALEYVIAH